MTHRIGIFVNPHAKRHRLSKGDAAEEYRRIGGDLADVRATQDLGEARAVAQEFKQRKIEMIGISGGDGTVHNVISLLIQVYAGDPVPPILILKSGTMDLISMSIRLKGKGFAILKRLRKALETGQEIKTHRRDTLRVKDRYGFLFGAGSVTNFLNEVYSSNEKGLWTNLKVFGRAVRESLRPPRSPRIFKTLQAQVTLDDRRLDFGPFQLVIAGTVEYYGRLAAVEFRTLPRANDTAGNFHAIVTAMAPAALFKNLRKIKTGRAIQDSHHYDGTGSTMEIQSKDSFTYTLDGDIYECPGNLKLLTGPEVRLIQV